MSQVFADSINSNPIYATRAEQDQNGVNIDQYYAKKTEIPSVPVTDVTVDGTSVVSNGTAVITMPTALVPDVTSSDDSKVLKATYSGGVGSYSWQTESGGSGLPPSTSTDEGKVLTVDSQGDAVWDNPAAQIQSDWTETNTADPAYILNKPEKSFLVAGNNITITEDLQNNTLTISSATGDTVPTVTSNDDGKVLKATYSGGTGSYAWDTAPSGVPTGGTAGQVLTQTANGPAWDNVPSEIPSHTPGALPEYWYNKVLGVNSSTGDLYWRTPFTYISVTPSSGAVALYDAYQSAFLMSSAEVTSLTDQYNMVSCFVIQWTATSSTTLPTVPSTWHAASANPTSLTVGKTYQLSLLGTCYSIVEFA